MGDFWLLALLLIIGYLVDGGRGVLIVLLIFILAALLRG